MVNTGHCSGIDGLNPDHKPVQLVRSIIQSKAYHLKFQDIDGQNSLLRRPSPLYCSNFQTSPPNRRNWHQWLLSVISLEGTFSRFRTINHQFKLYITLGTEPSSNPMHGPSCSRQRIVPLHEERASTLKFPMYSPTPDIL